MNSVSCFVVPILAGGCASSTMEVTKGADRPDASHRGDVTRSFDRDRFDDDRARMGWLRAACLTLFAVMRYPFILSREAAFDL
ncbi:MAG TPA: hypothetical protein VGK17_14000 [Propionicimonas sp.]|jgi:hypothetical protein